MGIPNVLSYGNERYCMHNKLGWCLEISPFSESRKSGLGSLLFFFNLTASSMGMMGLLVIMFAGYGIVYFKDADQIG